jgi:nucleolar protein 56
VKAYILITPVGIFALNEEGEIISEELLKFKIKDLLNNIDKFAPGKVPKEIETIIKDLENAEYDTFIFEDALLANQVQKRHKIKTEVESPCNLINDFKEKLPKYAVELKLARNEDEFNNMMHELSMRIARASVSEAVAKRDIYAVQAIRTIDDLDKTANLFAGRVREWYGLHFPELDKLIDSHEIYAKLVLNLGSRKNYTEKNLKKEGISKDKAKAKRIAEFAKKSMGAEVNKDDLQRIAIFAKDVLNLLKLRKNLEEYIDEVMEEVAPNMSALVGPVLSARLISLAGGLENLAKRSASTLQILGAEKALFRSLKTGSRPPKHGIIFQHALVNQAPRWQRGKVARVVSGKLAIASRIDAFGGDFLGVRLKEEINQKVDEIKKKYKTPPIRTKERDKKFMVKKKHGKRRSKRS